LTLPTDWKIAVAVRDDLETWQKVNLTAFVVSGLGPEHPELMGEPYVDGSGRAELAKFGIPVLVYAGDGHGVRRAFLRAVGRDLSVSVYTNDLFTTGNDVDNRAAIVSVPTEELDVAGFAVAGERKQVDKVFDKLKFHP
jgi:hypothetical protein